VTRDEQLAWEARWAPLAGVAALIAGFLTILSVPLFVPEDRKGIKPTADFLLSIDDKSGNYMASAVLSAVAALLLLVVFLYLFRAVLLRGAGVPPWFVYLVIAAPIAFAVARIAYGFHAIDVADEFASSGVVRGEAGNSRASDLLSASPLLGGLQVVGTVGVAFLFVMLPLRARRVGLLTPFMGVLGVIAGAMVVIPIAGISSLIQAFWLGALGMLFLGRWPGGRGPAWQTGEAVPWPGTQRARGPLAPRAGGRVEGDADPPGAPSPADPEPVPERPPSRKRRKRKR
jgi:hypothetical protein